jgi:LPXTG-motif cell wall-anchored protein
MRSVMFARSGRAGSLLIVLSVLLLGLAGVIYLAQPAEAQTQIPYQDPCAPPGVYGTQLFTVTDLDEPLRQWECGQIIVQKAVSPDDAPAGSFEFDPSWGSNFVLSGGGSFDTGLTLPMGIYSVAEVLPLGEGWSLASAFCDDGSSPAAIGVSEGETVTCTFNNRYEAEGGSLLIIKRTTPAGGAGFAFGGSFPAFTLDDGGSQLFDNLAAGEYTVTESPSGGWVFEDVVCYTAPGAAVDYEAVGSGVVVNLAEGQDVICKFANREEEEHGPEGSLTIIKHTVPAGGAGFGFEAGALGTFILDDGGSQTFTDLAAGAYAVTESPAEGWEFSSIECDALDYVVDGSSVTVNLAEGEAAVCTFTNGELPYTGSSSWLPLLLAGLAALLMGLGAWTFSWIRDTDSA